MANIIVKDLSKTYGKGENLVQALDQVSFEWELGEFVVVLGPSGSGKTTLLNLLGGMDKPTNGVIEVSGKTISSFSSKELVNYRRNDIGFVFQFYNLMANLTAVENIEIAGDVDRLQALETLKEVGLAKRKNNFPSQLSGGEQQRVAIARALVKQPKLLLCDEPTGALDTKTGARIIDLLISLKSKNDKTIVVVTHNPKLAQVADRIVSLSDGHIIDIKIQKNPLKADDIEW